MGYVLGAKVDETFTSSTLQTSGKGFGLGDLYTAHDGRIYKFVLFSDGTGNVAAVAGNVCYYVAETGMETWTVTSDLSDSNNIGAGVFQSVPADGEYCWVQVAGPATLTTALTAGADGNALTAVGATDGTLDVSGAVTDVIVAYAIDASAKKIVCAFPL
jgi:hypothetical protein